MKMDQEILTIIQRYHTASLSQEERTAFEERLVQDAAFAEEVKIHETIYQTIHQYGDQQLDTDLTKLGKTLLAQGNQGQRNNRGKIRSFQPWYVMAVAAAIALLFLFFLPQMIQQPATPGELYNTHFSVLTPPTVRSVNRREAQSVWIAAVKSYQTESYVQAIEQFQSAISDSSFIRKSEAWLYMGICYLKVDKPQEAMNALVQVSDTSQHIDPANWYISLAHLRLDQPAQARTLLQDIANDPLHEQREQALEILNNMEEL